jgi:hypothetical protein
VGFKVRAVTNYLQLSKLQASFAMSELLSDGETLEGEHRVMTKLAPLTIRSVILDVRAPIGLIIADP